MPAPAGMTTSTQITASVREIDFVTQFTHTWRRFMDIIGIMEPIRKAPGTKLVSSKAVVDGDVPEQVGEGEDVPLTKFKITPVSFQDLKLEKYRRAVTAEAVAKYGASIAVRKTDEAFRNMLFSDVMTRFYTFLLTGTLTGTVKTWQRALALSQAAVRNRFDNSDLTVTDIVGFANVIDYGDYAGDAAITIQSVNGLQYVKDFLGFNTLFLMGDKFIPRGKVVSVPLSNIDLYYIDPSDGDFNELGLDFRTDPELGLIGFHANGNYTNFTGESQAMMGLILWAEYIDGIAVFTVNKNANEALPQPPAASGSAGG